MGRFGLGKKSDGGDDDSNRLALFGSRSKSKSPAPSSNPYAQQPVPSMPSDAYQQAKINAGVSKGPEMQGKGGKSGDEKSKSKHDAPFGNTHDSNPGYAANKAGDHSGYGGNRYGRDNQRAGGGYGGLGSADPNDPNGADGDRDALFGNARERAQAHPPPGGGAPPPYSSHNGLPPDANESGLVNESGGGGYGTYGTYQERQLTAEEEEEEDVQAIKQDIRFMKQQDVSSTRNALRAAAQAEETGQNTLARLGAQGESIHNTEKHLDLASNHNRSAEEKARELKKLNKSMFAMNVSNPFTGEQRRRARDEAVLDRHQKERMEREETRRAAFRTEQRMEKTFKDVSKKGNGPGGKQTNLAERSKYQFEADSEDEDMENEIDSNLHALQGATSRLNTLAKATGKELEEQNKHLGTIEDKSGTVDDQLAMNRTRLERIR